ncbi:MAG: methyltransferase domain-containing protein [Ignavibacteriae bacterium]|nr:MAG: methyltransferase domain-containing protein [Ignavibacteriota bacterium]
MTDCPICNSPAHAVEELYDDRFGHPGRYSIRQCDRCGHCFVEKPFTSEELARLYTSHYQRSHFELSDFTPVKKAGGFIGWLNGENQAAYCWVPRDVRVLDVGCGVGETLAYHASRGCRAYGLEVDENVKHIADSLGLTIAIGTLESNPFEPDFFDVITMDQVVEHVSEPVSTLKEAFKILKPGGRVILSTPNSRGWGRTVFGRRWINWHTPYHLNIFSKKSMRTAVENAGFEVEKILSLTSANWLYFQLIHVVLYPAQGIPSVYWSKERPWKFWELWMRRGIKILHLLKMTHAVTRFWDLLGAGDNMVILLRKK